MRWTSANRFFLGELIEGFSDQGFEVIEHFTKNGVEKLSSQEAVRTRHPKEVTRATILQRAFEMYRDREIIHGDERLTTVLDSLGYTTGAGYQIWPNQAAFREDLKVFVSENIEYASFRPHREKIAALAEQDLTWEGYVLAAGDFFAEMFLGREEFYLSLRFFEMGDDRPASITDGMRNAYEQAAWEAMELFGDFLDRYQRRIRPGLEMRQMSAAATACIEGYALQARVRPEAVSELVDYIDGKHHQFSVALLGVANQFTEAAPPA